MTTASTAYCAECGKEFSVDLAHARPQSERSRFCLACCKLRAKLGIDRHNGPIKPKPWLTGATFVNGLRLAFNKQFDPSKADTEAPR